MNNTNIKAVWLDTKDVDVVPASIALLLELMIEQLDMGRDLKIVIGIPADDVFEEFIDQT